MVGHLRVSANQIPTTIEHYNVVCQMLATYGSEYSYDK